MPGGTLHGSAQNATVRLPVSLVVPSATTGHDQASRMDGGPSLGRALLYTVL